LPRAGASAPLIRFGSRADKVIAITVDDCYSPKAVAADLAIFERYHVNVTWFPIGYVAAIYPDLWREVDAAGFPIANHTFDHKNLTVMSYAEVLAEIRDDNKTLKDIIGHPIMPFVRPMGGSYNGTVLAAAHAAGELAVVNWDTTDGDTSGGFASWSNVGRLTTMGEGGKAGSIILMHANHEYTTAALPAIIEYYRARGFQFVTLGQLLGVPGPVPYGPEPSDWQPAPLPSPSPTSAPSLPY
jgi:peptidoglycan/xylan/chitin deacetylase (PgdA/CDA1 family)